MIRLFPDPVVVASAGPLPSATLHEIRLHSGTNARTTYDRTLRRTCQEIPNPVSDKTRESSLARPDSRSLCPHTSDTLEQELHRRLQQSRRVGVHDLSEAGAADVAIHRGGSEKLRVIENVEGFQSKLKRLSFSNDELFCYRHIEVV
jgi:hypothetical protein